MSANNNEKDPIKDTTWFLINCIMSTPSRKLDKINWNEFSEKMGFKNECASYNRYKRLLNSYGLTLNYTKRDKDSDTPEANNHGTPKFNRASKKRKRPAAEPQRDTEPGDMF
ncbi:hypothetical protein N7539_002162 [Penicillium diatomitis]|uniref:Myb-like DNA-binding domain-containing protein n=1 Tax=Penicillium diatomitis TaxID=2819901 RepID=A0A9W9XI34_9EURO|nr:uncharacterized protein N7539_002162 [Penicillium diatomitis]KAJ5493416.1 hypothetical protein N7539_002162 [Penicillium diatomitis]